ncbi:unnamed protein product [Lymnaea stagnalis]|uniref:Essential MCU regulator, mitochondrial n=1 Tax=Lymnaea stagnalis TaxID=6523 RepID=A0AAV2GY54_LYMST
MAANNIRVVASQAHRLLLDPSRLLTTKFMQPVRTLVKNESGAILSRPQQVRFGLIKIAITITPFLLGGATLSREFAAWLEEHELFVPDDDDD